MHLKFYSIIFVMRVRFSVKTEIFCKYRKFK